MHLKRGLIICPHTQEIRRATTNTGESINKVGGDELFRRGQVHTAAYLHEGAPVV